MTGRCYVRSQPAEGPRGATAQRQSLTGDRQAQVAGQAGSVTVYRVDIPIVIGSGSQLPEDYRTPQIIVRYSV